MLNQATLEKSAPPLRAVRQARGLTLKQVADRIGVDQSHLSKVERGESMLSLDALYRIAVVLELRELASMLRLYVPPGLRRKAGGLRAGRRSSDAQEVAL